MSEFLPEFIAAAAQKLQFYFLLDFFQLKILGQVLDIIFENSLPKGLSWQNMKKSVISVLKINSRYLQSSGLNFVNN